MSEKSFSESLQELREKKRLEEVQRTGFEGYCGCCGAPSFVGKEWIHDKECVWFRPDRFKQLAEQVGMIIIDDEFSTYGKFVKKFGELVVKECADLVADDDESATPKERAMHIKRYFGVEE